MINHGQSYLLFCQRTWLTFFINLRGRLNDDWNDNVLLYEILSPLQLSKMMSWPHSTFWIDDTINAQKILQMHGLATPVAKLSLLK